MLDHVLIYPALSILASNATRIAQGVQSLEVRSWQPDRLPLRDVVILENQNYLSVDCPEEMGLALAMIDIVSVHAWRKTQVKAACTPTPFNKG